MILYATKQTIERFKIKMPNEMQSPAKSFANQIIEKEKGDEFLEWGMKLFYFDRRKCLQVMHFASKLTIFLFDIKVDDIEYIANSVALYILDLYKTDLSMTNILEKYFSENQLCVFSKLTDRRIISSLNHKQSDYANDGYTFYNYIENGILKTKSINYDVNFEWIVTQNISGKTEYIFTGERCKEMMLKHYELIIK